jgi:hypothetical protein
VSKTISDKELARRVGNGERPSVVKAGTDRWEVLRDNDRRPKGRDVEQARGVSPPECNRP